MKLMNWISDHRWLLALLTITLASCGGSSDTTPPPPQPTPTLVSIALSPLQVALEPSGTTQLIVTGTYSDRSKAILTPASGVIFQSSNIDVATIDAN